MKRLILMVLQIIGRVHSVSPAQQERYALRLLLLSVPGFTSYNDVKTVDGVICDTSQEAARRRGLTMNEALVLETMDEAATYNSGKALRHFLVLLLSHQNPPNSQQLVEKYCFELAKDFERKVQLYNERQENEILEWSREVAIAYVLQVFEKQ